jgi:uncharacterized membrane protein
LAIGLSSYRYLVQVGPVPPLIADNAFKLPWLSLHVASAATALLIGPLQLLPRLRRRGSGWHRYLGRVYALGCLLGGASGLALALGSAAGPAATLGFGSLAVAWLMTTTLAWRAALARAFADHRAWVLRSLALTSAAITLRLYLVILPLLPVPFLTGYRAIAFLCWLPNLLVVELYLRKRATRQTEPLAAV